MSHVHGIKFRLSWVNCAGIEAHSHTAVTLSKSVGYPDMLRQNHTNQDIHIL
jgi:hypothetical protein